MKSFVLMLAFFTRIPVRASETMDKAQYQKGIKYLPLIGVIIGLSVGVFVLLAQWIGAYVAAFLALAVYLLMSGGLHMDGMADTVDGFAAHRDREGTLAVMKDSHIGTFGVLAICIYTVGMTVCMAQAGVVAAALFPLAGRTTALLCARMNQSATDGLGRWFVDGVKTVHVAGAAVLFAVVAALSFFVYEWTLPALIFLAFLASAITTVLVVRRMTRKLGGVTGDVIGFSIEFSQLVFLLFSAIAVIIL